ncbi:GntR family transcriptional regulator [Streptomyces sp. NPDC058320]|uniref:GntR family transcriptional regulator n=1 Tax=unclassified Streptomyces TaxID=2593676 RepID=UPI003627DEF6
MCPGAGESTKSGGARPPLGSRARDAILECIVDRPHPRGSRLVEREVAEELRMSRVPVREALRSLVTEGLLELLPHNGVRVRRPARADVEHLYEVWEPLAVQGSRLATRRVARDARDAPRKPEGLGALRGTLDVAERAAAAGEGAREVAAHTAFHEGIATLSGNPLPARTMEQLGSQLQLLFGLREEPAHLRAQHAVIFRHIVAGGEETAAASTQVHVRDSRSVALRSLCGDEGDDIRVAATKTPVCIPASIGSLFG